MWRTRVDLLPRKLMLGFDLNHCLSRRPISLCVWLIHPNDGDWKMIGHWEVKTTTTTTFHTSPWHNASRRW